MDERGRRSSGSTDARVREADSLQYELDEGPCLDAPRHPRAWSGIDDLGLDDRWPAGRRRRAAGSARGDEQSHGGRADGPGRDQGLRGRSRTPSTPHGEQLLALFSTQAAVLVANVQSYERAKRLSESMRQAVHDRDVISMAKGVLMGRSAIDEDTALRRAPGPVRAGGQLRRRCSAGGRRLRRPPAPVMARPDRAFPERDRPPRSTAAVRRADLTLEQLWTRYFALGGNADLMDVDAHLAGLLPPAAG